MLKSKSRGFIAACTVLLAATAASAPPPPPTWKLVGWNDVGMHWMDPDYSVFSIHPPANNLRAQAITPQNELSDDPTGLTLTYEAVVDPAGSINRTSTYKSNFWTFAPQLYGSSPVPDVGLTGSSMPGAANTPRAMTFDVARNLWAANGVPVAPKDDTGRFRPFPLMKLVLKDALGTTLASTQVVTPVSDEFTCRICHGSGEGLAAPLGGWNYAENADRDYRLNILRVHDELNSENPDYWNAMAQVGYDPGGLEDTVKHGTPVRCAKCHASNAYPGTGVLGVEPLTVAMHQFHRYIPDPLAGGLFETNTTRTTCYRCHPGPVTQGLRGEMGRDIDESGEHAIECQSCHGTMSVVASTSRQGWLDQPKCQSCHTGTALSNNGEIRYDSVFESDGSQRVAVDQTFATTPDVPSPGHSLFSASTGHGGLACSACHGPAHAEVETTAANDNIQNTALQGHGGVLVECKKCHTTNPDTVFGGPHGMHPVGQGWIDGHENITAAEKPDCRKCHGLDYRGTELSETHADRSLSTDFGTKVFPKGSQIGCYSCHLGPNDENANPNHRPVVTNAAISSFDGASATVTLVATDQDNDPLTYRIADQPAHGRVGISGNVATYYPEPGFAGTETFTFFAHDGSIDSLKGVVTVTRGAEWENFGAGIAGSTFQPPSYVLDANPALGTVFSVLLENTAGVPTNCIEVFSSERASIPIGLGGRLLCEPDVVFVSPMPVEGLVRTYAIPNVPALVGVTLYSQMFVEDPAGPYGFAQSRGLRVTFGP